MAWSSSFPSLKALVLSALVVCVAAKNKAPRIDVSASIKPFSHANLETAGESLEKPVVPEGHVFYDNYLTTFSWTDERLQQRLYHGREPLPSHGLGRRAPAQIVMGTVIKAPSCAGCVRSLQTGQNADLTSLTVAFLQGEILLSQAQLQGTCVFYTSVMDSTDLAIRPTLAGGVAAASLHPGLSKIATDAACANGKYTIWVRFSSFSYDRPVIHKPVVGRLSTQATRGVEVR